MHSFRNSLRRSIMRAAPGSRAAHLHAHPKRCLERTRAARVSLAPHMPFAATGALLRSPTPNPQAEHPPSSAANKAIACACVCARARPSRSDARVASPQLRCGRSVRASPNVRSGHLKGGPNRRPRRHGSPLCLTTPLAYNGATPPWRHALPYGPAIPDGSARRRAALGQASAARETQRTWRRPPPPPISPNRADSNSIASAPPSARPRLHAAAASRDAASRCPGLGRLENRAAGPRASLGPGRLLCPHCQATQPPRAGGRVAALQRV